MIPVFANSFGTTVAPMRVTIDSTPLAFRFIPMASMTGLSRRPNAVLFELVRISIPMFLENSSFNDISQELSEDEDCLVSHPSVKKGTIPIPIVEEVTAEAEAIAATVGMTLSIGFIDLRLGFRALRRRAIPQPQGEPLH